jgi:hypothetical protein
MASAPTMKLLHRTGVLTFHRCINYGSYWQARCLVEGLRARGHDAVLLDHQSKRVAKAEWQCALEPLLPVHSPPKDRLLYAVKALRFMRAFASLPRSQRFLLEDPTGIDEYELVVVGSDEVWNLWHPWYGRCGLFYGDGLKARRLVSYAASFGNQSVWQGLDQEWADLLRRFESISVRDENSWWMIKHFVGIEPELVLDPCLQFSVPLEGAWHGPREPFVAVYGHSFSPGFAEQVRRWARAHKLPTVSIGYRNAWADRHWMTAGPRDFAHFMARAEAVATNFFHGCVFSLRNGRPFVCEGSQYRSIKVHDLMAALGGERHLVSDETPGAAYDALLGSPLEPEIARRIAALRQVSEAYLDRVAGAARASQPVTAPQAQEGRQTVPAPQAA